MSYKRREEGYKHIAMTTKDLAMIILRVMKQALNSFAKEIGEEVTCQRCRKIERDYDLIPKKK